MPKIIRLYLDNTFEEKYVATEQDKIILHRKEKDYTPTFIPGKSVFREKPFNFLKRILMFWKKPRNLIILLDGAPKALTLDLPDNFDRDKDPSDLMDTDLVLGFNFGTLKDLKRFVYKVVAKSKADQKPISNMMFTVLVVILSLVLVFQILLMKGVKF